MENKISNNSYIPDEQLFNSQQFNINGQFNYIKRTDHPYLKAFKDNYLYMLILSGIFSILFTFSLYRNSNGIVTPIYPLISCIAIILSAKKVNITIKKDSLFFVIASILLGINLVTTKDLVITFLDNLAILLLILAMSLHIFYEDSKWGLGQYLSRIIQQLFTSFEYIISIIEDGISYRKNHNTKNINPVAGYILIGTIIALPLVIVVVALLGGADYFFGKFISEIFIDPLLNINIDNFDIIIMLLAAFVFSYAFMRKLSSHSISENTNPIRKHPAVIAITINSILGFVYIVFSAFQIVTLFLGNGTLPDNYTYAEYAREGFFQLVFVCLINMILVIICLYLFEDSKILKVSLTVISASTYLMIASSTFRMYMYVATYQLTYTRIFVFWALFVIFMAMNGITIYIYNKNFNLFKYCMIMVTIAYIFFAYSKPESLIAKNNLSEKFYDTKECQSIDYNYLRKLSSDATPTMVKAFKREKDKYGYEYVLKNKSSKNSYKQGSFREFNFSEYQEYLVLKNKKL